LIAYNGGMNLDEPLAYFITWTVYGTHLQGDLGGWRKRRRGEQLPQPRLAQWHADRLKHPILLLADEQREIVAAECLRHCGLRGWRDWAIAIRSNHCHMVVTATGYRGSIVRDQLKANGTRALREGWPAFRDRPVWTVGGDWQCINTDEDLDDVCYYVRESQDRKDREL
jgi:hypothetical protein